MSVPSSTINNRSLMRAAPAAAVSNASMLDEAALRAQSSSFVALQAVTAGSEVPAAALQERLITYEIVNSDMYFDRTFQPTDVDAWVDAPRRRFRVPKLALNDYLCRIDSRYYHGNEISTLAGAEDCGGFTQIALPLTVDPKLQESQGWIADWLFSSQRMLSYSSQICKGPESSQLIVDHSSCFPKDEQGRIREDVLLALRQRSLDQSVERLQRLNCFQEVFVADNAFMDRHFPRFRDRFHVIICRYFDDPDPVAGLKWHSYCNPTELWTTREIRSESSLLEGTTKRVVSTVRHLRAFWNELNSSLPSVDAASAAAAPAQIEEIHDSDDVPATPNAAESAGAPDGNEPHFQRLPVPSRSAGESRAQRFFLQSYGPSAYCQR